MFITKFNSHSLNKAECLSITKTFLQVRRPDVGDRNCVVLEITLTVEPVTVTVVTSSAVLHFSSKCMPCVEGEGCWILFFFFFSGCLVDTDYRSSYSGESCGTTAFKKGLYYLWRKVNWEFHSWLNSLVIDINVNFITGLDWLRPFMNLILKRSTEAKISLQLWSLLSCSCDSELWAKFNSLVKLSLQLYCWVGMMC